MTEGDKFRLKKAGYNFMDITDHPNLGQINAQKTLTNHFLLDSNPVDDQTKSSIKSMMMELDDKHLRADIAKLSSFWNRNYRSNWGLSSSNWIYDQVEAVSCPNYCLPSSVCSILYDADLQFIQPKQDTDFGDEISP